MIIYTVNRGDSVYSIARAYGTTPERIIADNDLKNPAGLVVGQTLVIQQPLVSYRVRSGDTVYSISRQFGISLNQLYRNNPVLMGGGNLSVGQVLNIVLPQPQYDREIDINGYVYPNVSRETLRRTLPYLTYITVFTYGIGEDGALIDVDDEEIIELARQYGVAPIMQISSITERGTFSTETAARLFLDTALQDRVIEAIVKTLEEKRYAGVDVDFEYVEAQYAAAYADFVEKLRSRLNPLGYEVFVALAPKYSADQQGLLYEGHDYPTLGANSDGALIMSYECIIFTHMFLPKIKCKLCRNMSNYVYNKIISQSVGNVKCFWRKKQSFFAPPSLIFIGFLRFTGGDIFRWSILVFWGPSYR